MYMERGFKIMDINSKIIPENVVESMKSYYTDFDKIHLDSLHLVKPRTSVLSCGCGYGRETKELENMGCKVIGIDCNRIAIEECRSKTKDVEYVLDDMITYSNDLKFDYIVCLWNSINILPLEDKKKFIDNCYNNLKERGKLIITTQHKFSSLRQYLKTLFQGELQRIYYPNRNQFKKWFEGTKFKFSEENKDKGVVLIIAIK